MRKWILAALAAVSLTSVGGSAMAQIDTTERPWAVRIGGLFPTDAAIRNLSDDTWFTIGIDYTIRRQFENEWVGAVDYATATNLDAWILQLLYKWHNPDAEGINRQFSFGVGGALYTFNPNNGSNQTELGIPIVGDWAFTEQIFLEGKYHWVVSDNDLNSFTLQLGYRF